MLHLLKIKKCCRGMTFIELIVSLLIVGISCTGLFSAANILVRSYHDTLSYTAIYNSTINTINLIKNDLENDKNITAENYSKEIANTKIRVDVSIKNLGLVFGDETYLVEMHMRTMDNKVSTNTKVILRKGSAIDVS